MTLQPSQDHELREVPGPGRATTVFRPPAAPFPAGAVSRNRREPSMIITKQPAGTLPGAGRRAVTAPARGTR